MNLGLNLKLKQRGSAPFTPNSISGLYSWVRSDLGVTLNGATVSAWADQSGNGKNLTQGSAASQPTFNATDADYNNLPSLTFDGVNDCLAGSSFNYGAFTIFMVAKVTSAAGNGYYYIRGAGAACDYLWARTADTVYIDRNNAGTRSRKDATNATWGVGSTPLTVVHVFDGTHAGNLIRKNGTALSTSDVSANDPGTSSVSRTFNLLSDNSAYFTTGSFTEMAIFNRALNNTEITQMEAYLQARYKHY